MEGLRVSFQFASTSNSSGLRGVDGATVFAQQEGSQCFNGGTRAELLALRSQFSFRLLTSLNQHLLSPAFEPAAIQRIWT
jgi:hypothetical protein